MPTRYTHKLSTSNRRWKPNFNIFHILKMWHGSVYQVRVHGVQCSRAFVLGKQVLQRMFHLARYTLVYTRENEVGIFFAPHNRTAPV